ncbi:PhoX family protein [Spirulina subsalsa]|uniref:PhoX family protein n=1 Tax=Spirulina subsalsa TaxID=54311 RepID=UPI0002E3BA81|nr:alkaline phosphatase PhoX [Spirulina subsalsa]
MGIKRRDFLAFLGASAGTVALGSMGTQKGVTMPFNMEMAASPGGIGFNPVKLPMPLETGSIEAYKTVALADDLVLPQGFTYDVIAAWGDRVGNSRFGYNNDYISFLETSPNEGYLTVSFEYISGNTWRQTYPMVIGDNLALTEVHQQGSMDAFSLPQGDDLKGKVTAIAEEMMIDMGLGVISLRRNGDGTWSRTYSSTDRRITGISGLKDGHYLQSTGPAVAVFNKTNKLGYEDGLKDKIIGTFANCAGGTSPWGTVFSAEENFQNQVYEPVMADGSSFPPSQKTFQIHEDDDHGCGNPLGLAGNKYGWMVEIDPANPNDYGTKHTWLGRYRHEAVGFLVQAGKKLGIYSGCDRRGGHLYKFVSQETVRNVKDKANSRLLNDGMLYGAKFNPDGTGRWIALNPDTPVNPVLPSQVSGGMVPLPNPNRPAGDIIRVTADQEAIAFKQQFKTLGDLYTGNATEKQGAILIDAHFAANAAGITCTARPEDTIVDSQGTLYIAFTSGVPGSDGSPDKAVFQGPNGDSQYEHGWIVKLQESGNDPAAMTFRWEILSLGGEPATGGAGFSNPDNIELDQAGHVWMVSDMSTTSQNKAVPSRVKDGQPLPTKDLVGLFGNNSIWYIPTSGSHAGEAYPFGVGPMECECTGPFFSPDQQTLFLAVQHPGEIHGVRLNGQSETRPFAMTTPDGTEFMQQRTVPLGSNWPGKRPNDPPKPAVVAIRRVNNQPIT